MNNNQYKYTWEERDHVIKLYTVAKFNPCKDEWYKFTKWYVENNGVAVCDATLIEKMVEEGRWVWLDWLADHGFCTKTVVEPVRRKLTMKNTKLHFFEDGRVGVKVDGFWVLTLSGESGIRLNESVCPEKPDTYPLPLKDEKVVISQ